MLLGVLTILALQPPAGDTGLAERVEAYRRQEPAEAAVRLAEKNVPREKRSLRAELIDNRRPRREVMGSTP